MIVNMKVSTVDTWKSKQIDYSKMHSESVITV